MIAIDTSSLVAFFEGETGRDVDAVVAALHAQSLFLPTSVLTEILSDPKLPDEVAALLCQYPLLEVKPGFWARAGELRARVLAKGKKARLGDALIAQQCLDNDIPLVTRDTDFRHFAAVAKLRIV